MTLVAWPILFRRLALPLVAGCILAASLHGAPPDWALRIASVPTPENAGNASAAILLDETSIDLDPRGVATTTRRFAIRIVAENGRDYAEMKVGYLDRSDKVKATNGWLIRRGQQVKPKGGSAWIDVSADSFGTLYGEYRRKILNLGAAAAAGDVFAGETVVVGPWLVPHLIYLWGSHLPVREETCRISVPPGFTLVPVMHGENPPTMTASSDARSAVWTRRDQPYIRSEPLMPGLYRDAPALYLRVDPPAGSPQFAPVALQTWQEVAGWLDRLNADQCDTNAQIAATARQLTADCPDPISKIRALGDYVQKLRYVAVNEGLGRGLGYQAHKASEVLKLGYGDCKDKANLLRSLLREVGIASDIALARSGDDLRIRADFPSPSQFDHAILAIRVDDTLDLPATVVTTTWGRLLFFDPTDPRTLPGDLPAHLQGTLVHLGEPRSDHLIELPHIPPAAGHRLVRKAILSLARDGSLSGRVTSQGNGQAAAEMRRGFFAASTDEKLRELAREHLGDAVRTAQLRSVTRTEDSATGLCGLAFEMSRPGFAQFLPNAMAVARLDVLGRGALPALPAPARNWPVKLPALAFDDEVQLVLPAGLAVEELPSATSLVSEYGRYASDLAVEGPTVTLRRRVELNAQVVPAADYAKLKKFLSDLGKADRTSLLLRTRP